MGKIRNTILMGLVGLSLQGCANLPNIYRNNLTIDSQAYKQAIKDEDINTVYSANNLEQRARNLYMLDGTKITTERFDVDGFEEGNNLVAYGKWKTKNPKEVLIYLNGLESHSGWFSEPAQKLAEAGIVIYGLDRRGSGLNTRLKGAGKNWVSDVDRIIEIAKKENPGCDINLASLCFGARIASDYAIKNPNKINSLIYISPGLNVKVQPNILETTSIILDGIGIQTNTQSPIKKDSMFTTNPKYLQFLKTDKLRTRAVNSDDYLDGKKLLEEVNKNLNRITAPSLVLLAEKDKIVDNKKTKQTLEKFGKMPEVIEYPTDHTIFFSGELTTNKFIKDIEEFILRN